MLSKTGSTNPQIDNEQQTTGHTELCTKEHAGLRLVFIDRIRIVLTMLVIIHHLAITYGALGPWYYYDPTFGEPLTSLLLTVLMFFNQAFFMSFFFLIAGYFTPGSYDRKGTGSFLRDRLLRLGVPLVVFTVLISPLISYGGVAYVANGGPIAFWSLFSTGPLWFVEALLLFAGVYTLWRMSNRKQVELSSYSTTPPTFRAVIGFTLALAIVTFLVRIVLPFGWTIPALNLQLPSFPHYIALFIVGLIAYRRNWFLNIPSWMGKVALGVVLGATLTLLPIAFVFGSTPPEGSTIAPFSGGLNWQALVYALWETIVCVGMCLGLLVLFRQRFNRLGSLGTFLAKHAYVVYIIHAPVIVGFAYAFSSITFHPLLKFVIAILVGIPLCFLGGYLVRKLPFARTIL